ncbi:MAG: hypothetical protein IJU56_08675 [Clostridia bacterium]|nr:hypothetical protein [Clostridia bacterium]
MNKNHKSFFERLFFNNKFLMVFSLLLAIVLWAIVKANYSETTTRVITGVKPSIDISLAEGSGYKAYYDKNAMTVDVTVSGRTYDINAYSLKESDISVKATSGYVNNAETKTLKFSAEADKAGVKIVKISPKSAKIFFDREQSAQFDVKPRLKNSDELTQKGYQFETLLPNPTTISVTGPATVISKIENVYLDANLSEKLLPQKDVIELQGSLSFEGLSEEETGYLEYKTDNPPQIIIPYISKAEVPTEVKFINQPRFFDEHPPKYSISPANVTVSYSGSEEESAAPTSYMIGTIDFSTLKNGVNTVKIDADNQDASLSSDVNQFKVTVDLSSFSSKTIDATASNVFFQPQSTEFEYEALLQDAGLNKVKVIGSAQDLENISAENLQLVIDVSDLSAASDTAKSANVNITIQSEASRNCWIYGNYKANVLVKEKAN